MRFGILPLFVSAAVWSLGSGVFMTLQPLRLEAYGFSTESIGLVLTANMVGFIVGCLLGQPVIASVGHIRAYAAFAAVTTVCMLALDWSHALLPWLLLRFAAGFATAALSVVTESWLNEMTTNEKRGQTLTLYVLCMGLFYGLGQLGAQHFEPTGSRVLMVAAGLFAFSLVPLTAIKVLTPKPPRQVTLHLLTAFKVSPTGAVGCFATGMIAMTFAGIGPLYGSQIGLPLASIAFLMAASQIGGIALQFPLGWLSDRTDRRYILVAMHLALIAVSVGFILVDASSAWWLLILLFAGFGGFAEALYPVSVAHANDRATPEQYVSVSSNLLLFWALGGAVGPVIGTAAIDHAGPAAFFWYAAIISFLLGLFTFWRLLRRRRIDAATTLEEFQVYPTTSPAVYEWVPHTPLKAEGKPDGKPPQAGGPA